MKSFQITGAFSTLCELRGKTAGSNMQIWRACFERPLDILEEQRKWKMENSLSYLVGTTFLFEIGKHFSAILPSLDVARNVYIISIFSNIVRFSQLQSSQVRSNQKKSSNLGKTRMKIHKRLTLNSCKY